MLIPVLNEERHIRETIARMLDQRFDGSFELLFADGRSEDRTRELLDQLAAEDPRIRVFDNPLRTTPSGLNVLLREARGTYVARMDAHTFYPDTYLAAGVERLRRGDTPWVSGPVVPHPVGETSRAYAHALRTWLGRGGSRKWDLDAGEHELDTGVFGGVWTRASALDSGGWDERWPINQDSEMAARFLDRGDTLICLPEMAAGLVPRDSLRGLWRQYWRYGFYRARTFNRHPRSMRRSHLIAPLLACTLAASVLAPWPLRRLARLGVLAYGGAVALAALDAARGEAEGREAALVAAVLPTMHLAWGFGTLAGMARFGVPVAALGVAAGRPAPPPPADPAAGVHAPSLTGTGTGESAG